MPNFTADQWIALIKAIGLGGVLALIAALLCGWRVWPWFEREIWPEWKARWLRADRQLEVIQDKREKDQVQWLAALGRIEAERTQQMKEQTAAFTAALARRQDEMVDQLKQIRDSLITLERRRK